MRAMLDTIGDALTVANQFQKGTAALDPDRPAHTTITLTQAQKDALTADFDSLVASVKTSAAGL